jgi:hypothetical protein
MNSASEKELRLPRSSDRQSYNGCFGRRLLWLGVFALMTLAVPASALAAVPQHWTLVSSPSITVASGQDGFAQATCPAGTVPHGGGAFIGGPVGSSLNSSYPDPNGVSWDINVNQSGSGSTNANDDLICAAPNTGYIQVASAGSVNPAGTTTNATADCPPGTNVLGGGAKAGSQDVAVNINSSYPVSPTSWQVNMGNASATSESFTVYAVCSNPFDGYGITVGPSNTQGPNTQSRAEAVCPSGQEPLGGGVAASSADPQVNINTNDPRSTSWVVWENDGSATATNTFTPYVTCANIALPYVRPRGATPTRVPLVPAYRSCNPSVSNSTHGGPLKYSSCAPPVQASPYLTLGTPDAIGNGAGANGLGSVLYKVQINPDPTPNDVLINISTTDVRCQPVETACGSANAAGGADYTGQLQASVSLRITDKLNGPSTTEQGTVSDTSFPVTFPCTATADTSTGSTCTVSTSANAEVPGSTQTENAIWQLGQVQVFDGGVQGIAGSRDATLFEDQGVFVP